MSARLGCWAGPKEREDERASGKGERDEEEQASALAGPAVREVGERAKTGESERKGIFLFLSFS